MRCRRLLLLAGFALAAGAKSKPDAPPGVPVDARLLTPIASYTARSGMEVEAALDASVCEAGEHPLPPGAILRGTVVKAHRVGLGLLRETASVRVEFRELRLPGGETYPVRSLLTAIDNARERVDRRGVIRGVRATATLSNRVGQRLALFALANPAPILPLVALQMAFLRFANPEIELARGAVLHLAVEFPAALGPLSRCAPPEALSDAEWSALRSLVGSLPYWTFSKRQPQRQDPVNLVYLGAEDALERAFRAVGWTGARPNSVRNGIEAVRAVAEDRAFADGPMRVLLLDGAEPDLRFQKTLNTFDKRDHLRVWARPDTVAGRQVWASAATRDLDTVFALRPFGFTHQIENNADLEREQVVSDLAFTGCVDWVAYVARPLTFRASGEGFRRGMSTDSRVAVVALNSCAAPREDLSPQSPMPRPGKFARAVRHVMLTARNHFLRDNIVWRSADALRAAIGAGRRFRQARRDEADARALDARLSASPELRRSFAVSFTVRSARTPAAH